MAIDLAENEVGFDTSLVGFPGLGSCMGLVIRYAHMDNVDSTTSTGSPTTVQAIRPKLQLAPPHEVTVSATARAGSSGLQDTPNPNEQGFYSVTS